jgi:hypothetical protein
VGLLGKTMSRHQLHLLMRYAAGIPLVIMLDTDALDEAREIQARIRDRRREYGDSTPAICMPPPEAEDLGGCDRETVLAAIRERIPAAFAPR